MNNSNAVYGLFYSSECDTLLGIYFLQGEAEAAREHYIAIDGSTEARKSTRVVRLVVGQIPDPQYVR